MYFYVYQVLDKITLMPEENLYSGIILGLQYSLWLELTFQISVIFATLDFHTSWNHISVNVRSNIMVCNTRDRLEKRKEKFI